MENTRVLTTTSKKCNLGCTYCFASDKNYIPPKVISLAEVSCLGDYKLVQPACDTEFFLDSNAFDILEHLLTYEHDVAICTKLPMSKSKLEKLKKLKEKFHNQTLNISVSFTSWDSYKEYEPYAPTPQIRLNLLKKLHNSGLHTAVNIRPLIPNVPNWELKKIIQKTHGFTKGYVSGDYWTTNPKEFNDCNVKQDDPKWMENKIPKLWYRVKSPDKMKWLNSEIYNFGKTLYDGVNHMMLETTKYNLK